MDNGQGQIRDWYRNGEKYRESVTEYIEEFHKKKYSGWEIRPNSSKNEKSKVIIDEKPLVKHTTF